ncbi:GntR family transcriptional regulator [Acerihabitans arboris]|uniref:GntR family transcriptional regulator n=1 Tax=Acerihabitans arboris TaxID=2691583 RepID=A0A845SII2_9GAMM|nr:GntR family transcriptional regulator [Acerihabitans arboris]NDL63739.1 GntR family transcriptional regulator [Acerihabitans arboris]
MSSWYGLKSTIFSQDKDDEIYHAVVKAIVEHQLPPGSKLPEEALAAAFGISRTGIRKVLQRLAAVHLIRLTPKRGAQVVTPGVDEARNVLVTRCMLECANLPRVVEKCEAVHISALEDLLAGEARAHEERDGATAIRLSALFHVQLQAISGNEVLTQMVSQLTLRSSLVIAAYGAPWQQGCRCHDHQQLVALLQAGAAGPLVHQMEQHFDDIMANLHFERSGETTPDFTRLFSPAIKG